VTTSLTKHDGDEDEPHADVAQDSHFDIALDDGSPQVGPILVDQPTPTVKRPIIPVRLRTVAGVKAATKENAGVAGYRVFFHVVRLPMYVPLGLFWALVGVFRLAGRLLKWWWHPELSRMLQHAADHNDLKEGQRLHGSLSDARKARGVVLLCVLAGVVAGAITVYVAAPRWVLWLVVGVLVPLLAHYGRPADKPIVSAAVVTPRHRRLNPDIVLRAYYAAGLGHPDKPGQQIEFGGTMARDPQETGSMVLINLPYGTTFSDAMKAREKIASGLDVAVSQVYLSLDKSSNRSHVLFVADRDPLSIPAGHTPLLDCKPRDIWRPAPLGLDERGRKVLLPLMWTSILIGSQPRKGKTFTARSLGLFAALDPYTRLSVFDGKGSPDWRKFALVAHTYGFGLLPDRVQGDPIANLLTTLRAAKKEVQTRNIRLSELPTNICPEGKLTRDIARDRRYNMPVWVIILDEFQDHLNTGDEEIDREIAELLVFLVKQGPSTGILFIDATQRPSGIGSTGKVAKLFTDFRDNHQTRIALKTGSWQVSELVLGAGAYSEGYDSSSLPVGDGTNGEPDFRGIGILYDSPVGSATVRKYLADGEDAEKILHAARRLRERLGTLDGMAAGEQVVQQARDPLADALDTFHADETFLSWETLADRLADQLPERYAQATGEALSKTLRGLGLGIESKAGAEKGRPSGERPRGVYLAGLRRALETRSKQVDR
jgi:hypothetical protein